METNYVLLMGLFLLLVAVDCSSSDPKGNVNEKTGLDQNVGDIVDPVNGKNVLKSASDSIEVNKVNVKANERDQIDKSGIESGTSKSNLNQQSGSNEGENLQKDGQESSAEAKATTDGEKEGDNVHEGQGESNVEAKGKMDGENEGDNVHDKGQEESNVEAKGKMDGEKGGGNVHKDREESKVEAKGKMDGETEGDNVHKDQEKSNVEAKGQADGEKKKNLGDSVDPKEVTVKKDNAQESVPPPPPTRTDGFRGEECDPSNMCMDKNERFAACLRVPGNESPDLSLLIQNKGKEPLTIKISAPAFVQLEETDVELQEKQDKKVKVSIKDSGTGNLIVLKDGRGECSLDFKDLIVHNSAESYVNFLSQTPTTTFIFVAAILILASGWMCMSFKRRQLARSGLKYQRLDMELPVSAGAKTERDVNDGWDNSWGNNWDDEEAPMTPLMPVTPSLSSKGLASRRLSKEGWKD
ncbi:uncharacterized protein LOC110413421 [Herrania umbratica]|uniref:Uncharacterized protein LOC110413421 n=1 Tax=Herrania umbratica TaxID=108875 RepID=A0A6J0ZYW4_9ROSI|nr:uncharacterized protein LOC110413421 [Herrania umbratica]XP_021279884.1 uncharacterized protein LOC110413421 [Herrania umbratica]